MTMSESDRRAQGAGARAASASTSSACSASIREDLNLRRNQELQALFERANRVIKQIAEAEKFDLILQEAVYRSPRIDITERVLKALAAEQVGARAAAQPRRARRMTRGSHEHPPSQAYSLREIVERFGGEIVGDRGSRVRRVATLENAGAGHDRVPRQRALPAAAESHARRRRHRRAEAARDATPLPRIVCANPYAYFARVSALLNPPRAAAAGHPPRPRWSIAPRRVASGAEIGPYAVIGRGAQRRGRQRDRRRLLRRRRRSDRRRHAALSAA